MANYGFDIKTISRLRGESVSKTASYIMREKVYDEYGNKNHYFTHVKDLLYSEILLPENAPRGFLDLETLLSAIDRAEKRYDARTGRVVRLALPNDRAFSNAERIELARNFVTKTFISQGMCAVLAIHEGKSENPKKNNPHAHVMLTDRPLDSKGFCVKKNRDWNKSEYVYKWRKLWAEEQNKVFKDKGLEVRVSHESLEVQGVNREPTIPLGRAAMALEKKGIPTDRGNKNRAIEARNKELKEKECLRWLRREKTHDRGR